MAELALTITLGEPHELILDDEHRFVILNAGRGFGKTQVELGRIFKHMQRQYTDAYGTPLKHKIWYIAPTLKQGKMIFWQRLKDFFKPMILVKNEQELKITLTNGAEIQIVGSEQMDNLRGPYLTMAIFDEFAFHRPNYWTRIIRPMLGRVKPYGQADFVSTPDGENEFTQLLAYGEDPTKPEWNSYTFTSLEGGFIPEDEIEAAKDEMTWEEWRQEYFAEIIPMAGRVYYTFDKKLHCKAVNQVAGLDIHLFLDFNEVPAVHMGCAHAHKGNLYVFDEFAVGNTEKVVEAFMNAYPKDKLADPQTGRLPRIYIYGDVSGDRETSGISDYMVIEHMLVERGYPKPEIKVTTLNPFEKDRVNSVNVKLKNAAGQIGIIINAAKCPKLVNDLAMVKRDDTGRIDKKTDRRITHISDALGYLVWVVWPVKSPATKVLEGRRRKMEYEAEGQYWTGNEVA